MDHDRTEETTSRFAIAAATLMLHPLDPEFADDGESVMMSFGGPLGVDTTMDLSHGVKETGIDIVHLVFAPGEEHLGPRNVVVIAERDGINFWWHECDLWSPLGDGPLLILPRGLNVAMAYDGKALLSMPTRPTRAVAAGIGRARRRLRSAARKVTRTQLEQNVLGPKRRAA